MSTGIEELAGGVKWLFLCGKAPGLGDVLNVVHQYQGLFQGNSVVAAITLMISGIVASRDQIMWLIRAFTIKYE